MEFFEAKIREIRKAQVQVCSFPFVRQATENELKAEATRVPFVGGKQAITGVYIRYSLPAICHISEVNGFKSKETRSGGTPQKKEQVAWANAFAHSVTKTIDIRSKGWTIQENSNAFLFLLDSVAPGVRENMHNMIGFEDLFSKRVEAAREKTEYFGKCFDKLVGGDLLELGEDPIEFHLELVPLEKFYVNKTESLGTETLTDNSPPHLLEFEEVRQKNLELLKENLTTALSELVANFIPSFLSLGEIGVELLVNVEMRGE